MTGRLDQSKATIFFFSNIFSFLRVEVLWLNDNLIGGRIPSEVGQLTNLKELALENNRLTSAVPLELQNIRLWGKLDETKWQTPLS